MLPSESGRPFRGRVFVAVLVTNPSSGSGPTHRGSSRVATLPLSLGGLGLRSAVRMREPAYWASWLSPNDPC